MVFAQNKRERAWVESWLPQLTFEDATSALLDIARTPAFVDTQSVPLLTVVAPASAPYIAQSYGSQAGSACLQVLVWAVGAMTPIHDHSSWGAYYCIAGSLLEQRDVRLDDGAQPNTAHVRKQWQRVWRRGDGVSTVQPYEGGIHRVANTSRTVAISLHVYGPRIGIVDGRDYDPTRDFVCDRLEGSPSLHGG
jgi:Cysteine dioxygenase type I